MTVDGCQIEGKRCTYHSNGLTPSHLLRLGSNSGAIFVIISGTVGHRKHVQFGVRTVLHFALPLVYAIFTVSLPNPNNATFFSFVFKTYASD